MHKLERLILEAFSEVKTIREFEEDKPKDTIKMSDLPKPLQARLIKQYGEFHEKDFVSGNLETYFKTSSVNTTTGSVGHKIIRLPSFAKMYADFTDIVKDIKNLMKSDDVRGDREARELFELIKTNYRKLQRYLRIERPEQYAMIRQQSGLNEMVNMFYEHVDILKESKKSRDAKKNVLTEESRKYSTQDEDLLDLIAHHRFKNDFNKLSPEDQEWVKADAKKRNMVKEALAKYKKNPHMKIILEGMLDELEGDEEEPTEEPTPEEEPDLEAPAATEIPDATDTILAKFPTVKAAIIKLQTEDFKEFVETIDWVSPRPSAFRVNLKNGQEYGLKWTGKTFEAQILGKRYTLSNIADYQQALDKLAILYKEAPMTGAGEGAAAESDTGGGGGGGGDFPGEEGGAEGGVDDLGGEEGGEEGGDAGAEPADLGGEEIDFEDGAEPEA